MQTLRVSEGATKSCSPNAERVQKPPRVPHRLEEGGERRMNRAGVDESNTKYRKGEGARTHHLSVTDATFTPAK